MRLSPSIIAQRWLLGTQMAIKRKDGFKYIFNFSVVFLLLTAQDGTEIFDQTVFLYAVLNGQSNQSLVF